METEAVEVAVAVARKLCSELISREPLGEITALRRLLLRIWCERTSSSASTTSSTGREKIERQQPGAASRAGW